MLRNNYNQLFAHQVCIVLEIRSVERGICPIAVRYFAVTRFCFNITLLVNKNTNFTTFRVTWRHRSRDYNTRNGWFPI